LRAGAVRMLDALIDEHPSGLTRDQLGERAGISTAGGTFSTYLGELTRNGLAERNGEVIFATDILMYGAVGVR
jgi:DNA-binding IclR family transcriptional regulator